MVCFIINPIPDEESGDSADEDVGEEAPIELSSDDGDLDEEDNNYEDIDTDDFESGDDDDEDDDDESEEEEDDDESNKEKPIVPKSIRVNGSISDISFHPSNYLLASATLRGVKSSYVEIYQNTPGEKAKQLAKLKISRDGGRAIAFSTDGSSIFHIAKDRTLKIVDSNTVEVTRTIHESHISVPHCMSVVDENILASGDEDGTIKLWDLRHSDNKPIMSDETLKPAGVMSITVDDDKRLMFALSDNGVMATYNARQRKFLVETGTHEFSLNCATTMKDNTKLVVGTDEGLLHLYNWDEFAAPSDSFVASAGASIESMTRVSENVLFAACDDNIVRAISILPNRVIKRVGSFPDLPSQKIVTTYDDKYVAGCSFDGLVKFFDVEHVTDIEVSDREKAKKTWKLEKKINQHRGSQKGKKRRQQAFDAIDPAKKQARAEFFSDLDSEFKVPDAPDSEDEDSDDDDDAEEKPTSSSSSSTLSSK